MLLPMGSSFAASTRELAKLPTLLDYVTNYFDAFALLTNNKRNHLRCRAPGLGQEVRGGYMIKPKKEDE